MTGQTRLKVSISMTAMNANANIVRRPEAGCADIVRGGHAVIRKPDTEQAPTAGGPS